MQEPLPFKVFFRFPLYWVPVICTSSNLEVKQYTFEFVNSNSCLYVYNWWNCLIIYYENLKVMYSVITDSQHGDGWDVSKLREEDFDRLATYFVPDRPCAENTSNRAEASLPRNLQLKPSHTLKDVSQVSIEILANFNIFACFFNSSSQGIFSRSQKTLIVLCIFFTLHVSKIRWKFSSCQNGLLNAGVLDFLCVLWEVKQNLKVIKSAFWVLFKMCSSWGQSLVTCYYQINRWIFHLFIPLSFDMKHISSFKWA